MHPLQPLSAPEIEATTQAVRRHCEYDHDGVMFVQILLLTVPKVQLWRWEDAGKPHDIHAPPRRVLLTVLERCSGSTVQVYARIVHGGGVHVDIERVVKHESVQPPFASDEPELCEKIVKGDVEVQARLAALGLDLDDVFVESWAAGYYSDDDSPRRRLLRPLLYARPNRAADSNIYARPVMNVYPIVDVLEGRVVGFDEAPQEQPGVNVPRAGDACAEFADSLRDPSRTRDDIKPLVITQPRGPSFRVDGYNVKWSLYDFHVSFSQREGLVLANIKYDTRPVVYRLSVAEMLVPYGCPRAPDYRKNAFDAGEDGLGNSCNSLRLGCDCLGEIHYFDASIMNSRGEAVVIENAICMHEEDDGILWKHSNWRSGKVDARRGRVLVVSCFVTVANYDYGFYFVLNLAGTIEVVIKLTGVLSTSTVPQDGMHEHPRYGTLLAPNLSAPIHQHFFCARIDMAVDGEANSVDEVEVELESLGPHNPHHNGFYAVSKPIKSEAQAGRDVENSVARHWVVKSANRTNRMGYPTAYRLIPGKATPPLLRPCTRIMERASFLRHALWITQTSEDERFPSGAFPNQRPGSAGVAEWVKQDRDLVAQDLTLWYTTGITHVVRPEEWPVMPCETVRFKLEPMCFHDCNPTLDLAVDYNVGIDDACHSCHTRLDAKRQGEVEVQDQQQQPVAKLSKL